MKSIFASSAWLYLGDAIMVASLIYGALALTTRIAEQTHRHVTTSITAKQLRNFARFQIAWLVTGLVGFKWVILQGGPGFTHTVGTGNHGSVQFSTAGELVAALVTLYGLTRWIAWWMNHTTTKLREQ